MSDRAFHRLQEVFQRAAPLAGDERARFLDEECGVDEGLRREVEDLLERDASSQSIVRSGIADDTRAALSEGRVPMPERVGPYEILGLLGRGGMGVVYRARQQNPERIVALKLLRPAIFSAKLLQRFELEKQVLARLQHPSIARIFGAGTTDIGLGTQPWFAMELIEGQGLSQWADGKSTRQKLELIVQLCEAVHHAHQNGVIHRDLKPDNIQVGADGRPKVLDFGVARVTDSDVKLTTIRTDVRSLVGTLPYMSPEQAQGETDRLGLASDVYALGVVTYELLCGELPYDLRGKPVAEAARVIADEDPRPLSSMDRVFRGDLETIVGKALAKEPGERYATAADLAADVLRFLRDEPIRARPPSTWYQLRKLAQRNRKLFLMTAGAFVALLGGTITSTVLALREAKARGAAVAQAKRAEEIADFALSVFAPRDPEQAERDVTAVLDHAVERVEDQLADHPDFAADLYYVIGNFYLTLARFVDAERTLTRAVAEHRRLADRHPEKLVSSLNLLRGCYESRRDAVGSARVWAELAELYDRTLGAEAPETVEARLFHASCLGKAGDFERANELLQGLMPLVERSTSGRDTMNVGAFLYRGGEFRAAEGFLLRVVEVEPGSTLEVEDEVHFWALFQLAALAADTGRLEEAERYSARMVEAMKSQDETGEGTGTAYSLYMRGHVLHGLGRDVECEQLARRAIRIVDAAGHTMGFPWRELGVALLGQGRLQEAEEALREYRDRQAGNGGDGEWYVGQAEALLGRTLRAQGRRSEAEALGRTAVERQRRVLPPKHPRIADALEPLAETLVELGRHDEAEAACLEALGIRRACMDEHAAPIASLRLIQAEILCARGEATAAFALAEEACLDFQAAYRPDHPEMARAHRVLARCAPPELARETREALWRTAYELRENALGPEHPDTRVSRHELEGFLSAHGE